MIDVYMIFVIFFIIKIEKALKSWLNSAVEKKSTRGEIISETYEIKTWLLTVLIKNEIWSANFIKKSHVFFLVCKILLKRAGFFKNKLFFFEFLKDFLVWLQVCPSLDFKWKSKSKSYFNFKQKVWIFCNPFLVKIIKINLVFHMKFLINAVINLD